MSPLPFPGPKPITLIVSFSEDEAATYAASKHLEPRTWRWVKDVGTFDGLAEVHVEYVGMHWRKRADIARIHEEVERKRARGEIR